MDNKKRYHLPVDFPSFEDLYRIYEELLRLRSAVEAEEARTHRATASKAEISKPH